MNKEMTVERKERGRLFIHPLQEASDVLLAGGKAVNLGTLMRAGLPVPQGSYVTTQAYEYFQKTGTLPEGMIEEIKAIKASLGGKVAIRSSATIEDGENLSMAGVFSSHYVTDDADIRRAIDAIYMQSQSPEVLQYAAMQGIDPKEIKMGLVVQQLIEPKYAGVIYTGVNGKDILIQYVDGFGDKLVDGTSHGSSIVANQQGRILQSANYDTRPVSKDVIQQLTALSEKIEALFPGRKQDIEFATSNGKVYILQARALTTELGTIQLHETVEDTLDTIKQSIYKLHACERSQFGTSETILSDSNFVELLPHPTEMDFGIFAYIFSGSDGIPGAIQLGRREMGYPLGSESIGFLHYIGGRPYMSIAADAATFYQGYPESIREYFSTLVNGYLKEIHTHPEKGSYPEMGLYLQDPTLEQLQKLYGERKGRLYFRKYQEFLQAMDTQASTFQRQFYEGGLLSEMEQAISREEKVSLDRLSSEGLVKYITSVLEDLRTVSCVHFVKAARLGFYYSQKLQAELARIPGIDVEKTFALLSQGLSGSEITDVNLAIANAPTDEKAYALAKQKIGHYSTGEMLEVRHPLLQDRPQELAEYVRAIRATGQYAKEFEAQKAQRESIEKTILEKVDPGERDYIHHIISSAQTYMALRETVKYHFVREYAYIQHALEALADKVGFARADMYFVYPRELPRLIKDSQSFVHRIASRKQAFTHYATIDMPSVIRLQDIENIRIAGRKTQIQEMTGKYLAHGAAVSGVVLNVEDFSSMSDMQRELHEYKRRGIAVILAGKQMNLGHDPLINQADGLIIQNAGIVSHGAQRARELGKGAIGGIPVDGLKTGTRVLFDPEQRIVRRLTS